MHNQVSAHEDPIISYRQRFIKAAEGADIETLVALATDDVVIMSPNDTTIYGIEEYRAWWEEYFQYFRFQAFHEPDRHVVVNGGFATEYAVYMIAIVPATGGNRMRDDGRSLTIWKRQPDDSWKIWQMMWNSSKPIGIGTNRYISRLMQKRARSQR
jgi:ketosteroid isomerase-like protein